MRRALGIATVAAAALVAAGCFADVTTWRSEGPIVEEVRHVLVEEHHAEDPEVECIKREVQGALYECRAETATAEYECELERSLPKEETKALECEEHAKSGHEPAEGEGEAPPEEEHAEE